MNIYLQGLTMGLAYVAPIGLQNLFVINSALTQKRSRVYITALIEKVKTKLQKFIKKFK